MPITAMLEIIKKSKTDWEHILDISNWIISTSDPWIKVDRHGG